MGGVRLALGLVGDAGVDPATQTLRRDAQTDRYFRHAIAAIPNLLDGLFFKFGRKSSCTHKLPPMHKG